jgi:pantothenate kinase
VSDPAPSDIKTIYRHLKSRLARGERCLVGIAGAPGAGKSTLVKSLANRFDPPPPIVGMDGFHLAQSHLEQVKQAHRKGAHYTFDSWGYVSMLRRISRQEADEVIYAPHFDRSIEDSIAAAVPVRPDDRLVLTEGNYLLIDLPPWNQIKRYLSLSIFLDLDEETRLERLIMRHIEFGKTREHAIRHVHESDQVNAHLVAGSRHHADFVVEMG